MAAQRPSRAPELRPDARRFSAITSIIAASFAATCGGNVRVDDDSADGAGGHGGSAQQGSASSNGPASGAGNAAGPSSVTADAVSASAGQGGAGAGGPCFTCAGYIVDCVSGEAPAPECAFQPLCPGSDQLFDQLIGCVCMVCAMECFNTCSGQEGDGPECPACQQTSVAAECAPQFGECANDA